MFGANIWHLCSKLSTGISALPFFGELPLSRPNSCPLPETPGRLYKPLLVAIQPAPVLRAAYIGVPWNSQPGKPMRQEKVPSGFSCQPPLEVARFHGRFRKLRLLLPCKSLGYQYKEQWDKNEIDERGREHAATNGCANGIHGPGAGT